MNIENYKHVLAIYEQGSITAAAKSLGMSQPALSISLNNMEKSLGFEIFDRKSKPLKPTAEGTLFIDFVKQNVILEQDFRKKIDDLHGADTRVIVGGPGIYIDSIVTEAVRRHREKNNKTQFVLKQASVPVLIEETLAGRMDCFVSTSADLPTRLKKISIKEEELYLCIPRDWGINGKLKEYSISLGDKKIKPLEAKKIDGLDVVSLLPELPLQKTVDAYLSANGVSLNTVARTSQATSAVKLAAKGIGLVIASGEIFTDGTYKDNFCFYQLEGITTNRELYMVYDEKRYLSGECRRFLELFGRNENI